MGYQVLIDDNFHYQDESERVKHGVFATSEEAVAACRSIVDGYLTDTFRPGMTADALFESYTLFDEDPFIATEGPEDAHVKFPAWDYARQRCSEIAMD
ncbi:hypothetical protein WN73_37880 [Bradyrhizobium sp. CCBAU 45394]|uniref:hypothetical protein n=1 Tax=Bradyrhizobium sp. CCBAU 45394 TaxID=1325087 RepID=UPI00230428A7|nr:hypothetical protein [Bradyrhizobium sp. CCBAU 45394]MDA9396285.1 hypothetical protein [Bradyrhizobium sp. CCBAU 45394]